MQQTISEGIPRHIIDLNLCSHHFFNGNRFFIAISEQCRYVKEPWTECDPKTNMRSRTLTLKKGDQSTCEPIKTIQKKCKKGNYTHLKSGRLYRLDAFCVPRIFNDDGGI